MIQYSNTYNFIDMQKFLVKFFIIYCRWLYDYGYSYTSPEAALEILEVAIKFSLMSLQSEVLKQLSDDVRPRTVLIVLAWAYNKDREQSEVKIPSAPPYEQLLDHYNPPPCYGSVGSSCLFSGNTFSYGNPASSSTNDRDPPSYSAVISGGFDDGILQHWTAVLDAKAEEVLQLDEWEDISSTFVASILRRDTLKVSSESVVVDALVRWANAQCRRRKMLINVSNRRTVLQQLIIHARVLVISPLLTQNTFAPLYFPDEMEYIIKRSTTVPQDFINHLDIMSRPRGIPITGPSGPIVPRPRAKSSISRLSSSKTKPGNSSGTKIRHDGTATPKKKMIFSLCKILGEIGIFLCHLID